MLNNKSPTETTTFRHPPYTYLHLSLFTIPSSNHATRAGPTKPPELDAVTALQHLTSALQQSLGLVGTAIPIDILKIQDQDIWIRVPYEDGSAVVTAVSQWSSSANRVALRLRGRSAWLGGLVGRGNESELWTLETQRPQDYEV